MQTPAIPESFPPTAVTHSFASSFFIISSNAQSYSGLLGDVNQLRSELHANTNFALTPAIFDQPGLVLHLYGYGGHIRNFNRKKTRYFDRFFLSGRDGGK